MVGQSVEQRAGETLGTLRTHGGDAHGRERGHRIRVSSHAKSPKCHAIFYAAPGYLDAHGEPNEPRDLCKAPPRAAFRGLV